MMKKGLQMIVKCFISLALPLLLAWNLVYAQQIDSVGSYTLSGRDYINCISVQGDYAYLGNRAELLIIDISDPANPTLTGTYSFMSGIHDIEASGNYVYLTTTQGLIPSPAGDTVGGFHIVDVTIPASPSAIGYYGMDGFVYNFFIYSHYAYIINNYMAFEIADISDPLNPVFAGGFNTPNDGWDVFVVDTIAYIADREDGMKIYNMTVPLQPVFLGGLRFGLSYPLGISVKENYAFAVGDGTLNIVNVTDPTEPSLTASYITAGDLIPNIFISGDFAFLSEDTYGFEIINISDPSNPFLAVSHDTPGFTNEIIVIGNYIYVSDTYSFQIFHFNPTGIKEDEHEALPEEFTVHQNYPNPFNSGTVIQYDLTEESFVTIDIFDMLGRKVETLVDSRQAAGHHQVTWNAGNASSGIYFYNVKDGKSNETKRMNLVR
jgi:hypothetical protein